MFIQSLFFALTLILTLLFFLYGFNHYYLINAARNYRPRPCQNTTGSDRRFQSNCLFTMKNMSFDRLVSACAVMAETYGIEKVENPDP